ncbi:MAG: tRNA lysidine(34) synthetase TilS [Intestinimonas sp.]|jgi:tRNA(Ile)-lysidine synthase|nr:tRNA lysidine(34) synthetase TilS [Intestinimonas sp.]
MLDALMALTREYGMLPQGGTVLCAVSGGADSMCLLHRLLALSSDGGFTVAAAHYDHCLRGEESARDANFVRAMCGKWGVPLTVGSGDVAGEAVRRKQGVEETARRLRYTFLRRTAARVGAERIATAHTADDNAETLLLHLVRGTGLQGLGGIAPRRGGLIRPLLTTTRAEIEQYLVEHHIPHVEDSTNANQAYTRNRLRHQVLPVLRALNPRFVEDTAAAMARLRADNDCLNARAAQTVLPARETEAGLFFPAARIAREPDPVAARAARILLARAGDGSGKCSAAHLTALVALCRSGDPSASLSLPGGITARRSYDLLWLAREKLPAPFAPVSLCTDGITEPAGTGWLILCHPAVCPPSSPKRDRFFLAGSAMEHGVTVRPRQSGDVLRLPGRRTKTLKKLLVEEKVPRWVRDRLPVLAGASGVLAVAGIGPAEGALARPGEAAFELAFVQKEK